VGETLGAEQSGRTDLGRVVDNLVIRTLSRFSKIRAPADRHFSPPGIRDSRSLLSVTALTIEVKLRKYMYKFEISAMIPGCAGCGAVRIYVGHVVCPKPDAADTELPDMSTRVACRHGTDRHLAFRLLPVWNALWSRMHADSELRQQELEDKLS